MGQAVVWIQLVMWALFALAMVGCVESATAMARHGLKRQAAVEIAVGVLCFVGALWLHRLIEVALA